VLPAETSRQALQFASPQNKNLPRGG
jgi:hypothetical protein